MSSVRENILVYIAAQVAAVTGVTVYRSREAAVSRAEGVVIILKPIEEAVAKMANEVAMRELTVSLVLVLRGVVPDTTADPYLVQITNLIQTDTTLGGLAARCVEKTTRWDMEMADISALVVELTFIVKYITQTGSLNTLT